LDYLMLAPQGNYPAVAAQLAFLCEDKRLKARLLFRPALGK
jgi:hypothetical protein